MYLSTLEAPSTLRAVSPCSELCTLFLVASRLIVLGRGRRYLLGGCYHQKKVSAIDLIRKNLLIVTGSSFGKNRNINRRQFLPP